MSLNSANFNQIQPDQAVAICSPEHAAQLTEYDGYQVMVAGHIGLLLTKEWLPLESHSGPYILTVVFHRRTEVSDPRAGTLINFAPAAETAAGP